MKKQRIFAFISVIISSSRLKDCTIVLSLEALSVYLCFGSVHLLVAHKLLHQLTVADDGTIAFIWAASPGGFSGAVDHRAVAAALEGGTATG